MKACRLDNAEVKAERQWEEVAKQKKICSARCNTVCKNRQTFLLIRLLVNVMGSAALRKLALSGKKGKKLRNNQHAFIYLQGVKVTIDWHTNVVLHSVRR